MTTWVMEAYDTERRVVTWRHYTRRDRLARAFESVPKIQFSDSGHGVVFTSSTLTPGQKRLPTIGRAGVGEHVRRHLKGRGL